MRSVAPNPCRRESGRFFLVNTPSDDALNDLLARAIQLIGGFDSDAASGVENLKALEKRLEDEHFNLAVLGQFKRGKSTLLNSLLRTHPSILRGAADRHSDICSVGP